MMTIVTINVVLTMIAMVVIMVTMDQQISFVHTHAHADTHHTNTDTHSQPQPAHALTWRIGPETQPLLLPQPTIPNFDHFDTHCRCCLLPCLLPPSRHVARIAGNIVPISCRRQGSTQAHCARSGAASECRQTVMQGWWCRRAAPASTHCTRPRPSSAGSLQHVARMTAGRLRSLAEGAGVAARGASPPPPRAL